MSDPYFLGAYWSGRKQSAQQCAEVLEDFLKSLSKVHPLFHSWCKKGVSKRDVESKRLSIDAPTLLKLVLSGTSRRDADGDAIQELGFQVGLWNGHDASESSALTIRCGGYNLAPGLSNSVVLKLPEVSLLGTTALLEMMRISISIWGAEHAVVTSNRLLDALGVEAGGRMPGWITYVRKPKQPLVELEMAQEIEEISGCGEIALLTSDIFSIDNAQHMQSAQKIAKALSGGLI